MGQHAGQRICQSRPKKQVRPNTTESATVESFSWPCPLNTLAQQDEKPIDSKHQISSFACSRFRSNGRESPKMYSTCTLHCAGKTFKNRMGIAAEKGKIRKKGSLFHKCEHNALVLVAEKNLSTRLGDLIRLFLAEIANFCIRTGTSTLFCQQFDL